MRQEVAFIHDEVIVEVDATADAGDDSIQEGGDEKARHLPPTVLLRIYTPITLARARREKRARGLPGR